MSTPQRLANFVQGTWRDSSSTACLPVTNPATATVLAEVPMTSPMEVQEIVAAAQLAFEDWRRTPVTERVQYLFKLKHLLEANLPSLAETITNECGKTRAEALGELRRGIESVETACGLPSLIQGVNNEDVASGIDEHMFRQPLGVVAAITPFNFPAMIPLWFLPYAIGCGNCFVLKPSEKVPLTSARLFELLAQTGLPPGVAQLVHGGSQTVESLLDHPLVQAVSFVGSTPVARYIYQRATSNGKRAQCQGGAKNPLVVLPDADLEMTTQIAADSAFGCAGQRCLATSVAITVGAARWPFTESMAQAAAERRVGCGLDEKTQMGPLITRHSQSRVEQLVDQGVREGAHVLVDGRAKSVPGYPSGFFIHPTILDGVNPYSELARTEIFGPVLSLTHTETLDEAIALVNGARFGNMACLFTSSGADARKFRQEAIVGNVGINVGVAAPMAFFPFSGWKDSFFGDLHAQGRHGIEFYTQTKVVVERWPREWSRKF